MEGVEERLQTFTGWSLDYLQPRQLAEAGFVYLGHADAVSCHCCQNVLTQWEVGEDPWKEHARHFPACFFVQSRRPHILQTVHSSVDSRLETFRNWPLVRIRQGPLAEAGFCYSGVRHEVTCHCCLVTLDVSNWGENDDAWDMHFKHSPGCVYVLQHWPQVGDKMSTSLYRYCSFTNWPKKNTIRVPSLVDAGFFYKGISDQVGCYSCNGMLELWDDHDQPCAEHARHFPQCALSKELADGQKICPHDLDAGTHKSNVSYRLATFWNWPTHFINPTTLANAGFMYTGRQDEARCFSCGTCLSVWMPNDHPWVEHLRHAPSCRYALMHAPLNVLSKTMDSVQARLSSFRSSSHTEWPIPCHALAEAGFFSCQTSDYVRCFSCGVLLFKWESGEDPLKEHFAHSPHCPFIKKRCSSQVFDLPSMPLQSHHDMAVQGKLMVMGFTQKQIDEAVRKDPHFFSCGLQQQVDSLLAVSVPDTTGDDYRNIADSNSSTSVRPQQVKKTSSAVNRQSSSDGDRLLCKVCLDEEVSIVFTPCGHLACCSSCAPPLDECPICRQLVRSRVRAIVS